MTLGMKKRTGIFNAVLSSGILVALIQTTLCGSRLPDDPERDCLNSGGLSGRWRKWLQGTLWIYPTGGWL